MVFVKKLWSCVKKSYSWLIHSQHFILYQGHSGPELVLGIQEVLWAYTLTHTYTHIHTGQFLLGRVPGFILQPGNATCVKVHMFSLSLHGFTLGSSVFSNLIKACSCVWMSVDVCASICIPCNTDQDKWMNE